MSKKLLPCPFCGGEARLTAAMGETWMRCIDCNAGSEMSGSRALAIAAWNRRAPAPEGEAWGYATRRIAFADGTKVDGPWGLDTGLSLDMARTDPCWEVQPLYASPVVPVGSGEAGVYTQADYEEAAALGERDGYEKAVQDIDLLTGGDGEYKATTHDGVIDMPVMKARIIQRFSSLRQLVVPVGVSEVLDAAAAYLKDTYGASYGLDHPVDRARILAALRPTDTGWRDIATAPKDGQSILAICGTAYSPLAGVTWWQEGWTHYSRPAEKWHGGVGKWFPTHWMPLPPAPTDTGRE